MLHRINRILIPIFIIGLLSLTGQILSVGQAPVNSTYYPLMSYDPTGWIGPYGGTIVTVVYDPTNLQVAFAGSFGSGMYKSTDGGLSWNSASRGLGNLYINSLAIDPTQPSVLYAGTYRSQVYKSEDGGNSWVWSGNGMQDQAIVYTIAIDPINPSIVYAGTRGVSNGGQAPWNGVVYKSTDAGHTWSPVWENVGGADAQDWVYSLVVDPFGDEIIYAATHEHGPYKSATYGDNWYAIQNGIDDLSGRAITMSHIYDDGTTMYYGVWHNDTVYKTLSSGSLWFRPDPDIPSYKVYSIALDPGHVNTAYLATFTRGVMRTLDGGLTWQPKGLQGDMIYSLAISPVSSDYLLAGTEGDGLYRSADSSSSWQTSSYGINNAMVTSVVLSPSDARTIYASIYGAGVYQTKNRGQSWDGLNTGLTDKFIHALVMDPAHPGLLYAMTDTGGLFQNDLNTGNGWTRIGQGLPLTQNLTPAFPADHPFATREMQEYFAAPQETMSANLSISAILLTMVYAPSDPQIAYIGTGESGVYKSTNGGTNWQPAGLGGESVLSMAVDLTDRDLVYAATDITGSIKVSADGGSTWTDAYLPVTFYSLAASPTQTGVVYAGTNSGIYRYQSGNWTALGLSDQQITSIAVDPEHPGLIYAGTTSGAYYTMDEGTSWKFVNENLRGITIQSISIDPTNPRMVYFSTTTHGILLSWIRF